MSKKKSGIFADMVNALSALKFARARDPKLSKLDFGVLKVAMMVAALDGEVQPQEVEAFGVLAKKCRGYGEKSFRDVRESAFRSAGYIALLAQHGTRDELLSAFLAEALAALPDGFAYGNLADVRRAFVTWIALGVSDGNYSDVERSAIEALRRELAEIKRSHAVEQFERWAMLSPTFRQAAGSKPRMARIVLVDDAFLDKAEKLVKNPSEAEISALVFGE